MFPLHYLGAIGPPAEGAGPYALTHNGGIGAGGSPITVGGVAGGTDCLRVLDVVGNGIVGAAIRLYAASDLTFSNLLGSATTGSDGRWAAPIYCGSGTYALVISATGDQSAMQNIVVP